jgi:hypothetical protein
MNAAASLLNDTNRTVYTYTAQLPYLKMALLELRELYELNSIPVTEKSSAVIQVDAGQTEIAFNVSPLPELPDDLVEPLQLWERTRNINPFIPMTKQDFLPHELEGIETSQFIYYVWQEQKILLLPANQNNDIKIDYIKQLFQDITDENSQINVINAQSFLQFRTAGLLAEFIERNLTSATAQNSYATGALDRAIGIGAKGKQNIVTRRRPFRSGYKRNRIII